eukprot:TRINITY_DN7038_c0_g1_i1.p1 TRINITY_DN7038_c0_g1~~TRINITY_DN7038_c0_g1_i1.p1  ORF type:complete len:475 (-),score=139.69 TRINITY_DN7038_c0_g1_i1:84-1508(-)
MASNKLRELVGNTFVNKAGEQKDFDAVCKGRVCVGLYFSAHWCGPCRGFTPKLATFYEAHHAAKNFEMIFVSSDNSEEDFKTYLGEMPWCAIPYENRDMARTLGETFEVEGIPTLVLLDADGNVVTKDARGNVSEDPEAIDFPWRPLPFLETFFNNPEVKIQTKSGEIIAASSLLGNGKTIGIYFSGSWCGPCHHFTPVLAKCYNQLKADGKQFEVVFVSSDRDEESFKEYYGQMPWLAVPFADRKTKMVCSKEFDVTGIPTLVILDGEGKLITADGREEVMEDEQGKRFPWLPEKVPSASKCKDYGRKNCCVLFMENLDEAQQDRLRALLTQAAEANPDLSFSHAGTLSGMSLRLRSLCQLGFPKTRTNASGLEAHQGTTGRWYCGRPDGGCRCGNCDGQCGPNNGCNCEDCLKLDTAPETPDSTKLQGARLIIMTRATYFLCEAPEINADTLGQFIAAFRGKTLEEKQIEFS